MAFNIGVNVVEVDGRAAPAIAAAPVSVAGFLIMTERGIPNLATPVRGAVDLVNYFGNFTPTALHGPAAVRGFFDNGGTEAFAVRITNSTSVVARVRLRDRATAPVNTLEVLAGSRGRLDPGAWGNSLSVVVRDNPRATSGIPAQIIGTATEPFNLSGNQPIQFVVNGATTAPVAVTFAAADFANVNSASAAEVAATINRRTTQVRAAATPAGTVIVASAVAGSASRLVGSGAAATTLGLAATSADNFSTTSTLLLLQSAARLVTDSAVRIETPTHAVGAAPLGASVNLGTLPLFNVSFGTTSFPVTFTASDFASAALNNALPGEIVAAINRQGQGRFTAGLTHDLRLVIRSTQFGGATMAVDPPNPAELALGFTDVRAALSLTTAPLAAALDYRQVATVFESSGLVVLTAAPAAAPVIVAPVIVARLQSVEFDLVVRRGGVDVEQFESLTMQTTLPYSAEAVINDPDAGSLFITVRQLTTASGVGANVPAERRDGSDRLLATTLGSDNGIGLTNTPGTDVAPVDTDFTGDPAARTGLYSLDQVRIQLLACPDTQSVGVTLAALGYCEQRGDAMFVGTTPLGLDLDGAKTYASNLRARKVFGALYWPWIDALNPLDTTGNRPRITIPPVGHVLGVYARIADSRGVFKAPAGDEALVRNALAVERDISDVDHTDLVKSGSVNAIRAIPGSGIIIDSSRTLSTDTRWLFVGTRRLMNFVKTSLRDGLRFVSQEPHSEELRRAVRLNVVTPFLLGLWRQGAFGSDEPDDVFTVICDASNNPPAEVNLGNFRIEVYFYPVKPAETIIIIVGQQESGAAASES